MKPWDVSQLEFPHGSHPAVIISLEARYANADIRTVNDWETLCRCDVMFLAQESELTRRRGC